MKITRVETFLLQKPLTSTMRISRGGFTTRSHCLVRVHTDTGLTGLGEGVGTARYVKALIDGHMGSLVLGLDPMRIETIRAAVLDAQVYFEHKGSAICAASAIETACWDIRGKALGLPVYELLGGLCRAEIDVYASDVYIDTPDAMAARARSIVDRGIRTVKAHIGTSLSEDTARVEAMRRAIGSDAGLMIDLNCGYTYTDALRACTNWARYDLTWLEEPLRLESAERLGDLRARCAMPIAAGENEFRVYGFKSLFERASVDVAMPDIGRCGGIEETKRICGLAAAFGVEASPHCFSSGVLLAATVHVLAATPEANWLEFDTSGNAVYDELLVEPMRLIGGRLQVSHQPGLGCELTPEIINRYGGV